MTIITVYTDKTHNYFYTYTAAMPVRESLPVSIVNAWSGIQKIPRHTDSFHGIFLILNKWTHRRLHIGRSGLSLGDRYGPIVVYISIIPLHNRGELSLSRNHGRELTVDEYSEYMNKVLILS